MGGQQLNQRAWAAEASGGSALFCLAGKKAVAPLLSN